VHSLQKKLLKQYVQQSSLAENHVISFYNRAANTWHSRDVDTYRPSWLRTPNATKTLGD